MHLILADGRKPLQELVYGRAPVEMIEQRCHRQSRATEAPRSAQLSWASIDSAAKRPVHAHSLSLIGWSFTDSNCSRCSARPSDLYRRLAEEFVERFQRRFGEISQRDGDH